MIHTIILNLDRSADRRSTMEAQFKNESPHSYFPAYDGKDMINQALSIPIIKGVGIGRKLLISEVAVIMSHIGALKHAQIMGYDEVIILEDDVVISEDFYDRLTTLKTLLPSDWEYVYLSGHSDYVKIPMYQEPTVIPAPPMIGAFAYLANKEGIKKLIKYCGEFVTTYDDMIMHKIKSEKLKGYIYLPFCVYHAGKESLIWDNKTVGHISHNNNMHSSFHYFKNKI